ncbi:MAG: TrmB family transcriptional regulator [Promethearchaeota archaeon]
MEVKKALKLLGFSDYNIVIYDTLLRERELDARQLSSKTRVPYSRVYEILNEMIEKGYIIKVDGRPSTYVPKSPIDVLQHIQHKQQSEFKQNSAIVKDTLMRIYSEKKSAQNAQFTITYGKDSNTSHMKTLIKNAVRSICIMLKDFDVFFGDVLEELKLLSLKHVDTRIIVPTSQKKNDELEKIKGENHIKYMDVPPSNLVFSDEKNTLIVSAGDYLKNVSEDMIGISISHAAMAFVSKGLFMSLWDAI